MHHEENEHRHPHFRETRYRRDRGMHHPQQPEHFQDFRSRWGEPEPLIHLNHQSYHPHEIGRPEDQPHYHQQHEDWHDPRHNQYEQPIWRQRDVYFHKSNQRVEDRWYEDPLMPHPHQNRRTRPDSWDEDWGERRR